MTIFDKNKMAMRWAYSICSDLVKHGIIDKNNFNLCVKNAYKSYIRSLENIEERYLESIIGKNTELAKKVLKRITGENA